MIPLTPPFPGERRNPPASEVPALSDPIDFSASRAARVQRVRMVMETQNLTGLLITNPANIYYLSGFTSGEDGRLLLTLDAIYLITDGRYFTQAEQECPQVQLVPWSGGDWTSVLAERCQGLERLGYEAEAITVAEFNRLTDKLPAALINFSGIIEQQRMVKDEGEQALLRASAAISDAAWSKLLPQLSAGMTERQIAALLAFCLQEGGCSGEAFATIAAAGINGALPHARPGEHHWVDGELLTCDFGGFYQGYAGDMTRTIALGSLSPRWRERYQRLLEIQQGAVEQVKAGIAGQELHRWVVKQMEAQGWKHNFNHGLGHGVGLAVHEGPRLSLASSDILQANMVVTVEPGIYFPGEGGLRIEDTVIVKDGGCERITRSDKALLII